MASPLGIDAGWLAVQAYQLIRADQELSARFGLTRGPGYPAASQLRAANLLLRELDRLIDAALSGRRELAGRGFARFLRHQRLIEDDYHRIAHYLLTVALAHRVGPDNLVRIGAVLADIEITRMRTELG
jgi:hypothetical protein